MKAFVDEDLFGDQSKYDRVFTPLAKLLRGGRSSVPTPLLPHVDIIGDLYEVSLELRDRLRFSDLRMKQLKGELRDMHSALMEERTMAAAELAEADKRLQAERSTQQAVRTRDAAAFQEQLELERSAALGALERERALAAEQLERERSMAIDKLERERSRALNSLGVMEKEVEELNAAVQEQSAQMREQERQSRALLSDLADAQQQAAAAQQQAAAAAARANQAAAAEEDAMRRAGQAMQEAEEAIAGRGALSNEIAMLRSELQHAHERIRDHEAREGDMTDALLLAKNQLSELSHLQGLYAAAREELDRLDKENTELKEMVQGEVYELTKSRILDTVGPTGQRLHHKSSPMFLTPEMTGKRAPRARRAASAARAVSPGRDPLLSATGVMFPSHLAADIQAASSAPGSPTLHRPPAIGASALAEAARLASLAFLGPPSSAYHTDPDKFVFVRVAGGFSPKYVGPEPLPRASGWVPKAVVRLVQAFRHSYGLVTAGEGGAEGGAAAAAAAVGNVPWVCWEPLLLMIDEVYRRAAAVQGWLPGGTVGDGTAGSGTTLRYGGTAGPVQAGGAAGQQAAATQAMIGAAAGGGVGVGMASVASYPSVIQAERILALRKQLAKASKKKGGKGARRALGGGDDVGGAYDDHGDNHDAELVRRLAEKDYHRATQLGESERENSRLRGRYSLLNGGVSYEDPAAGGHMVSNAEAERQRLKDSVAQLTGELYGARGLGGGR